MTYIQKLQSVIKKNNSNVVVGLDPDIEKIPEFFFKFKNPVAEFNKLIINLTKDIVAGYKPNMAFYECLLEKGIEALKESLNAMPDNVIKICDAKRSDMKNTAGYYALTYFDIYDFDSITLNPYMGKDSVEPFLERKNKAVYLLALTSNTGGKDFQFLDCGGKNLYRVIIEKSLGWSDENKVGFVFGANYAKELNDFTTEFPDVPLLIPGIGAQDNDLGNLMTNLHSENFVINSSRSIIYSSGRDCSEKDFMENVRKATEVLNTSINDFIKPL